MSDSQVTHDAPPPSRSRVPADAVPGFVLSRELGRGGMGVVFEAMQTSLGRRVALKMIMAGEMASQEQVERFRREARVMARFQHPNVVQVFDTGEANGRHWYALEFCDGGSLADRLQSRPISVGEAVMLVAALADAVAAVHAEGVLHRDLKPDNVLFTKECVAKVADFGLVREQDGAGTQIGTLVGTLAYMPPEQARGETVDERADVYALGAILYACLTGRPPYRGANTRAMLLLEQPPSPVRSLNGDVSVELESVCKQAMHPDKALRFQSAVEFAAALRVLNQAKEARTPPRPGGKRWGLLAFLLVACLVVVGIGAVWLATQNGPTVAVIHPTKPDESRPIPSPPAAVRPEPLRWPCAALEAKDSREAWAAYLGEKSAETTIDLGSGERLRLLLIPPGTFIMGSLPTEAGRDNETQHKVVLTRSFFLGTTEITRGQFRRFIEDTKHKTEAESDGQGGWNWDPKAEEFRQDPKFHWLNVGFEQTDEHPVVNVSWGDAVAFCDWLTKKSGRTCRLPTEAEWEWACRAGSSTAYSFGDDPEELAKYGNVADGTAKELYPGWTTIRAKDGHIYTSPVRTFRPNAFGLYDMHGNVWEWCSDWWGVYPGGTVSDPGGPEFGETRVLRGGCWDRGPWNCRSGFRPGYPPSIRGTYLGFRVAVTAGKPPR